MDDKVEVESGVPFDLAPGSYSYVATVAAAGPTTFQVKAPGGAFQDMTDGVITASGDGIIEIAAHLEYQATIQAGDSLFLSIKSTGLS